MFSAAEAEQEHWGGSEHISFADVPESSTLTRADLKCFMDIAGCRKSLISATRLLEMAHWNEQTWSTRAHLLNRCHYVLIAGVIWCESIYWNVRYLTAECVKGRDTNEAGQQQPFFSTAKPVSDADVWNKVHLQHKLEYTISFGYCQVSTSNEKIPI